MTVDTLLFFGRPSSFFFSTLFHNIGMTMAACGRLQKWPQILPLPLPSTFVMWLCNPFYLAVKSIASIFGSGLVLWLALTRGMLWKQRCSSAQPGTKNIFHVSTCTWIPVCIIWANLGKPAVGWVHMQNPATAPEMWPKAAQNVPN